MNNTEIKRDETGSTFIPSRSRIPKGKVYYPSGAEFVNPLEYIRKISKEATELGYGVVKVVPPQDWEIPFHLNVDKYIVNSAVQDISCSGIGAGITGESFDYNLMHYVQLNYLFEYLYHRMLDGKWNEDYQLTVSEAKDYLETAKGKMYASRAEFPYPQKRHLQRPDILGIKSLQDLAKVIKYRKELEHKFSLENEDVDVDDEAGDEEDDGDDVTHDYKMTKSTKNDNKENTFADHISIQNLKRGSNQLSNSKIDDNENKRTRYAFQEEEKNTPNDTIPFKSSKQDDEYITQEDMKSYTNKHNYDIQCNEEMIAELLLKAEIGLLNKKDTQKEGIKTSKASLYSDEELLSKEEYRKILDLEKRYWSIINSKNDDRSGCPIVTVEYANDQTTADIGCSGFPSRSISIPQNLSNTNSNTNSTTKTDSLDKFENVQNKITEEKKKSINTGETIYSSWNLNNLPYHPESALQHADIINGITVPWLYLGMLFSTFHWHVEDNYLYSISYLHCGSPKVWYNVGSHDRLAFERVFKNEHSELFKKNPLHLHNLSTHIDPLVLLDEGVNVSRHVQMPGEFMITFPQAYHCGFSTGFSCAEAVNFALDDWFLSARNAKDEYSKVGRESVIAYEHILISRTIDFIQKYKSDTKLYLQSLMFKKTNNSLVFPTNAQILLQALKRFYRDEQRASKKYAGITLLPMNDGCSTTLLPKQDDLFVPSCAECNCLVFNTFICCLNPFCDEVDFKSVGYKYRHELLPVEYATDEAIMNGVEQTNGTDERISVHKANKIRTMQYNMFKEKIPFLERKLQNIQHELQMEEETNQGKSDGANGMRGNGTMDSMKGGDDDDDVISQPFAVVCASHVNELCMCARHYKRVIQRYNIDNINHIITDLQSIIEFEQENGIIQE